jgi:electron transfer DM13
MHRPTSAMFPIALTFLLVAAVVAACSSAGSTAAPAASPSAMVEHSAMPSESAMAEESAMAGHSAPPNVAAPVSMGTFHGVDGNASGTAALFHKPDGAFVITFEDFSVASAAHIDVVLVPNKDVTGDADIDKTTIVDLGPLQGTTGMQDYTVPASADAMTLHTVVLWDTEMAHAVAAAPLG